MCHPALLTERTYNLNQEDGINWYSALDKLREFPSVVKADFYDLCSSAGDWNGYIVQKIKDTFYLILFSQENNYPRYGFTVYTDKVNASWKDDFTNDEILKVLTACLEQYQ